jgi:F-type H+-transporting ATPase subunit delta
MKSPKQIRRQAKRLFRWCVLDGLLDEDRVRQVIRSVLEAKHRGYLDLLSDFERLVRLESERHVAQVESAEPLPSDLQSSIRARLQDTYGSSIKIRFSDDTKLIGGLRVRVGSDVYDGTVQHGLLVIARNF